MVSVKNIIMKFLVILVAGSGKAFQKGEGSGGSCIAYGAEFYVQEALEVTYKTNAKYFTEEEVQEFEPDVFTSDTFNSEDFFKSAGQCEGTAIVSVEGIWYDNETVELELYFVLEGELDKHRVLAQGPAGASSLSQFKFHAREAIGQLWGRVFFEFIAIQ